MPYAFQEIRARAGGGGSHPAYEVRPGAKNREYSPVPFGGGLQTSVYLPSVGASFKQRG